MSVVSGHPRTRYTVNPNASAWRTAAHRRECIHRDCHRTAAGGCDPNRLPTGISPTWSGRGRFHVFAWTAPVPQRGIDVHEQPAAHHSQWYDIERSGGWPLHRTAVIGIELAA